MQEWGRHINYTHKLYNQSIIPNEATWPPSIIHIEYLNLASDSQWLWGLSGPSALHHETHMNNNEGEWKRRAEDDRGEGDSKMGRKTEGEGDQTKNERGQRTCIRKDRERIEKVSWEKINRRWKWMTMQKGDERRQEWIDQRCDKQNVRDRERESKARRSSDRRKKRQQSAKPAMRKQTGSCTCGYPCWSDIWKR